MALGYLFCSVVCFLVFLIRSDSVRIKKYALAVDDAMDIEFFGRVMNDYTLPNLKAGE